MIFLVHHEHASHPLHEAELDHRGDVRDGFLPLDQTALVIVNRPQREAGALELAHVAGPVSLHFGFQVWIVLRGSL